ncbi:anti-sigma regulatory factor (Ser/Thr protein kinase) [Kitasatospora sp. MAP12-15]|uniref:ATP-binding protein n=1 Tax=unclassified Kitasatospora TaxID=2633591 RepID=UPI002475DABB|nr:ATP-binding protein [Kitasatospora sp. MAP12-44]MDH6109846.1 anti-sigma regulatory factor (Ser/Thr protein kinase) [Kitasatospora sp. MAP12-44]
MDSQARFPEGAFRIEGGRRLHAALASAELGQIAPLRCRLRAALGRWGVPELADTAELLLSELVTNALLHTSYGARIDVLLDVPIDGGRRLRVEIGDHSVQLPRPRGAGQGAGPAEDATSGRGLLLVEALADAWGVQLRGHGKITWFELTLP